ncbi:MAG TPA: WHG domain-containing protein [Acidimicrobiia bacterium]|nr:WHG domain-containing protein [Acidimicrobiia bacterium]
MPAPSRTSLTEIVAAGLAIVEAEGVEGLTMQKVSVAVGVQAPSLYKRVAGRGALLRLIAETVLEELGESLGAVVTGSDPRADLEALANAFRDFARGQPGAYRLLFAPLPEGSAPGQESFVAASLPVLRTAEALVGPDRALDAARLVTAWAHGFLTMELAGAFRMSGDLDEAFRYGVDRLTAALSEL